MVETTIINLAKEFHCYKLLVKLECLSKDDQHQEELIIQQYLLYID
jgi:hypothetical protein